MGSIDPGAPQIGQPYTSAGSTPQAKATKTGTGMSQITDNQVSSTGTRSAKRSAPPPNAATLPPPKRARVDPGAIKEVKGGNPFMAPSVLATLSRVLMDLMMARADMAKEEGLMSADFTLQAQEMAESLASTIMELAEVEAKDFQMKAIISAVSAVASFGMAAGGGKIGKLMGGEGMMQANRVGMLNSGMQAVPQIIGNLVSADTALKKGALEAIKTIKEFVMQQTQKAGQDASRAGQQQKEDFGQLQNLLDKVVDNLTKWHGQRG